jgi:hypothetical protein
MAKLDFSAYTHEELTRKHEVRGSSNRTFGFVFAAFFLLLSLAPLRKHGAVRGWGLMVSGAFLILAIGRPLWLQPWNRAWTRLGLLLNRVVSPVVMAVLFFFVFTPVAFIVRLLGKDPLRLALNAQAHTYWIERVPPGPAPGSMSNQF